MSDLAGRIENANLRAMELVLRAEPVWIDVQPLGQFLADLPGRTVLHNGPPIEPENLPPLLRTSICGAAVHEGLADDLDQAWQRVLDQRIHLRPARDFACACGGAQAITASTPMQIVENRRTQKRGAVAFQEGPSADCLRWGRYNSVISERMSWFSGELGPVLGGALRDVEGIDLRSIVGPATAMGDENHCRQEASSSLLFRRLASLLVRNQMPGPVRQRVLTWLAENGRFFLHVLMAAAVAVAEGIDALADCTVVTTLAGNGYQFGIQVAGLGKRWFTAPCPTCEGAFVDPAYDASVAGAYCGDSSMVETWGFGASAAAAGPTFIRAAGGDMALALARTAEARRYCLGEHDWAPIPADDFRGPAVGIDIRRVLETGILPTCHGGMHHVQGGLAGIGAIRVPRSCFAQAAEAMGLSGPAGFKPERNASA